VFASFRIILKVTVTKLKQRTVLQTIK